ncbi:MAG: hypothetical protein BGO78_15790 [Chloroflexi bacterium 44-23]|nr:MAG: hypothetical protein BGO78_15790 [Chloroflexi bacterium 44-23]
MNEFSKQSKPNTITTLRLLLPVVYIAGRLLFFLALMPNDLHGFGDFQVYFDSAAMPGLPYFNYWSEYPPIFAWLIKIVYWFSQGNQFLFDFLFFLALTIASAASIWLVAEISKLLNFGEQETDLRTGIYFGLLAFTSYTWWYFDPIPVVLMLAAIYYLLKGKETSSGIWLGLGILAKWFPIILLPAVFRFTKLKTFMKISAVAIGITVVVWGLHLILSPTMTWASLQSQPSRSSWQTIWALIDGNLTTGAFVPMEERVWPEAATFPRGNSAVIPNWATLLVFGGIGLFILLRSKRQNPKAFVGMAGITWALFLLWSPGWSPQWILYLFPLILLTFKFNSMLLYLFSLSLITIIEWPFLLTHHLFLGLWLVVPIRMLLLIGMILQWIPIVINSRRQITHIN